MGLHFKGKIETHQILVKKKLAVTNALAYCITVKITTVKEVVALAQKLV
jgi:hypothetical protein